MMRQKINPALKLTAVGIPLSLFSIVYVKAIIHAYHEHLEHLNRMKTLNHDANYQPRESTMWSRFKNTYLPLFPMIPESKPITEKSENIPKGPK